MSDRPPGLSIPNGVSPTPEMNIPDDLYNRLVTVKANIRKQLPHIFYVNNILVIGARDVGKSSLINSIWLAISGQNEECSPPVGVTFHLGPHTLYTRNSKYNKDRGIRFPGGTVQFCDTRGLHLIHEESKASLIIQYLLEGRMDRSFFHQALMQNEESLKHRFAHADVSPRKHYKAVIFVERKDATNAQLEQTERLARITLNALARSKYSNIRNLPVVRALNAAHDEVKQLGKNTRLMSNVSSTDSLNEMGLPNRTHNLESYQWRTVYEGFDDERLNSEEQVAIPEDPVATVPSTSAAADGGHEQVTEEGVSQRFEFRNRYGPKEINPEQHLSLLLFLDDLLKVLINPNCESAKAWRLEKAALAGAVSSTSCTITNVLRVMFGGREMPRQRAASPGISNFPIH